MRRAPAFLLLLVIASFLGLAAWDNCEPSGHECPPACHIGCVDGCGVVTAAEQALLVNTWVALAALTPEALPRLSLGAPLPELSPPRS